MDKFTPAPWSVRRDLTVSIPYRGEHCCAAAYGGTEANAYLIAAAPDAVKMAREIKHSITQARISGNDWKRELSLIENTVDQWLKIAKVSA